jgi:hypothetical protein
VKERRREEKKEYEEYQEYKEFEEEEPGSRSQETSRQECGAIAEPFSEVSNTHHGSGLASVNRESGVALLTASA